MGPRPMTNFLSHNPFDLAIYLALFVAVVMGFMTGMLRSLATIFGYLAAAPIAVVGLVLALCLREVPLRQHSAIDPGEVPPAH